MSPDYNSDFAIGEYGYFYASVFSPGVFGDLIQNSAGAGGGGGHDRAKAAVIAILGGNSPCADFFNKGSTNTVADFANANILDVNGPDHINVTLNSNGDVQVVPPFMWDASLKPSPMGSPAIIQVNNYGGFYHNSVKAQLGPASMFVSGSVGPFEGGSLGAQVDLLLHEFAHFLKLIPSDKDNADQSVTNAETITKTCLSAIQEAIKAF